MDELFVIVSGTNWYGPYDDKGVAKWRQHCLKTEGDSLGMKVRNSYITTAVETSKGLDIKFKVRG